MLGTIRRHQTWLWAIIITVTVASFVIFGPTNTRMGEALKGNRSEFGVLAGKPITREEYVSAMREVDLEYLLRNEKPPEGTAAVQGELYQQLFINHKLKEFGIQISTEAVAARIRQLMGDSVSLDTVEEKMLKPAGLDLSDLERFFRHKLGIEQLIQAAGVTGKFVTPQEAETMYRAEHREIQTQLAYFSASNYLAKITVTPEALSQFYSNQVANYRIPDQVEVSYVKYSVSNYTAAVPATLTNLNQIVDDQVRSLGTNLFRGTKTSEESKAAIRKEVVRQAALKEARKNAGQFAETLDQSKERTLDGFMKLAAANKLKVETTAGFDRDYGPQEITVLPAFTKTAFGLTKEDPFGGPIAADDAVYVIALKAHNESRTPLLSEIQTKVSADFRYVSAMRMAQQEAVKFHSSLTNALASGQTFAAVCSQASVKPETLPPFALDTRSLPDEIESRIDLSLLKQAAFGTGPGKSSAVAGTRDGAFVLYVEKLLPIDETKLKADLPGYITYLRQARQNDAFNQWFNAEIRQDPEFLQTLQRLSEENQRGSSRRRS